VAEAALAPPPVRRHASAIEFNAAAPLPALQGLRGNRMPGSDSARSPVHSRISLNPGCNEPLGLGDASTMAGCGNDRSELIVRPIALRAAVSARVDRQMTGCSI
jgi:hypothetical protein